MSDNKYGHVEFESFDVVRKAILENDVNVVCRSMASIGMECDLNAEVISLINSCVSSKEEWVRRSAFICLYHLYVRYKDAISDRLEFITYLVEGRFDQSDVVQDIVQEILSRTKEFSPNAYEMVMSKSKN